MAPRASRLKLSTHTYFHICSRGNNGQSLFQCEQDFSRYLSLTEKYIQRYDIQCFAYCLMDNHIHLLLRTPSLRHLSKFMQGLQVSYVIYFNRKYERRGHLFQDRFSSWVIKDEHHLLATKTYIENNPVKAEMVRMKEDYIWSSASGDTSCVSLSRIKV